MARQTWTPVKIGHTGSCNVTYSSGSSEGEEFTQVFHRQAMLYDNGSTMGAIGSATQNAVTVTFVTYYTLNGLTLQDKSLTIAGNAKGISPMFGKEYQQADGKVYIDYPTWTASDMVNFKMALVQLSS